MSIAIPGAKYLFSILQSILVDQPHSHRLRINHLVQAALQDWIQLATTLTSIPMPITAFVPHAPHFLGAVEASGSGIGGFWVPTTHSIQSNPMVFRFPYPPELQHRLISASNPTGDVTNSTFELAALVFGTALWCNHHTSPHATMWWASDNVAATSWCNKGSTSSVDHQAYLLRWLAQLTRDHNIAINTIHVPGTTNTVADFCSRSFHLSDQEFLHQLHEKFPMSPSWKLAHWNNDIACKLNLTLSRSTWPLASPKTEQPLRTLPGWCGLPSATSSRLTPPCKTHPITSSHCNSSPIVTAAAKYLPVKLLSVAKQWETQFVPLARRWPTWDTPTLASCHLANFLSV
jgi:hypothetical protein